MRRLPPEENSVCQMRGVNNIHASPTTGDAHVSLSFSVMNPTLMASSWRNIRPSAALRPWQLRSSCKPGPCTTMCGISSGKRQETPRRCSLWGALPLKSLSVVPTPPGPWCSCSSIGVQLPSASRSKPVLSKIFLHKTAFAISGFLLHAEPVALEASVVVSGNHLSSWTCKSLQWAPWWAPPAHLQMDIPCVMLVMAHNLPSSLYLLVKSYFCKTTRESSGQKWSSSVKREIIRIGHKKLLHACCAMGTDFLREIYV